MTRTTLALACLLLAAAAPATAQWEPAASPPGDVVEALLTIGDELYCSSYLAKVYVTTDHAQSWTEVGTLDHGTSIVSMILLDDWLVVSRQGWAGNHRIQRVNGAWTTWEPLPDQDHEYLTMTAWGGRIYAVRDGEVVVSDDHAASWSPVPAPDARRPIQLLSARGALFALTFTIGQPGRYLYRSVDGGAHWLAVTGIPSSFYLTVWVEHQGAIYLVNYLGGGDGDVYRSLDDGLSFQLYDDMPSTGYAPSAFASAGPLLAVGYPTSQLPSCFLRDGDGAWDDFSAGLVFPQFNTLAAQGGYLYKTGGTASLVRAPLPATTASDDTPPAPAARLAVQPNPFNPRTSVVFAVSRPARLAIYDPRGHRVREVPVATAGQWTWDGSDDRGRPVPSGTYLLRLEDGERVLARKSATLVR
jgi:hypothetical protein